MPQVTINISQAEYKVINYLAVKSSITVETYIETHIQQWVEEKVRTFYKNKIDNMSVARLRSIFGEIILS
jgi:hypothetical protein